MNKLAVLLPTYNAAAYLKESVDSILNQSFVDFDLYIYDDCSTDNTEEIISAYKDARVYYRKNNVNSGIAKTLNLGLQELLPHYEYIARMDADDWSYPERFLKQISFLESNPEVVLCGTQGYWLKDLNKNPTAGWEYPTSFQHIVYNLLFSASFGHSSVIFRSDCFQKHSLQYTESIQTCEDWELWIRVAKIGQIANLPDFLMKYRILESSNHRSAEKIKIHLKERSKIISDYWSYFGIDLNEEEIFECYYSNEVISKAHFIKRLMKLIVAFNAIYIQTEAKFTADEQKTFSYMLARKILDFWKRAKVSRYNMIVCWVVVKNVKFMSTTKLIKSIIR